MDRATPHGHIGGPSRHPTCHHSRYCTDAVSVSLPMKPCGTYAVRVTRTYTLATAHALTHPRRAWDRAMGYLAIRHLVRAMRVPWGMGLRVSPVLQVCALARTSDTGQQMSSPRYGLAFKNAAKVNCGEANGVSRATGNGKMRLLT